MLLDERSRGITYEVYAKSVRAGELVCREDMAKRHGVTITTATYHLERAVYAGLLSKSYGYISNQPGWLYYHPGPDTDGTQNG